MLAFVSCFPKEHEKKEFSINMPISIFYNYIHFLKLIHFLSILYKWKTTQHLPLSKDWQTVYEHIELACGLWQPVPTLLHQLVNYRACGNSCESDLFYPGILLQKPSQHCQLPARKGRNSNSLKNIFPPSKILLRHYRDAISVTTIFKVLSYLI